MMKLVVLAMALTACSAAKVNVLPFQPIAYQGLPAFHGLPTHPIAYHGLPANPIAYHGLPANPIAYHGLPAYPFTYHGLPAQTIAGLPSPVTYTGLQGQVHPLTYTTGPLVAPAPYTIQTGVKTEVAAKPVEQHGYVIKY